MDLIEQHAFENGASPREKREAYLLAKHIENADWAAEDVRKRARKAVSGLLEWGDPVVAARAERARLAKLAARTADLHTLGLPRPRVEALAHLEAGPYDVVLAGLTDSYDERAVHLALRDLGFTHGEILLLLERVEHIAPEPIAQLLHQSVAVRLKVALETGGAKVRIKSRN
jgi:hypothetical protein